jgi:hypothetical protein
MFPTAVIASAIGNLRPSLPGDALTHLLFDAGAIGASTIEPVARLRRHRGRAWVPISSGGAGLSKGKLCCPL